MLQFSVRVLMLAVLAVALVCSLLAVCLRRSNWLCDMGSESIVWDDPSGGEVIAQATYAFQFDRLVWLVLQSSDTGRIEDVVRGSSTSCWIELPSGDTVPLPGDGQVYEYREGRLVQCQERLDISKAELSQYIGSRPDKVGFESLKRFVELQRRSQNSKDGSS